MEKMIDIKAGKTAYFLGKEYKCVESAGILTCNSCAFFRINAACRLFLCGSRSRKDHKNVQFKEVIKRE